MGVTSTHSRKLLAMNCNLILLRQSFLLRFLCSFFSFEYAWHINTITIYHKIIIIIPLQSTSECCYFLCIDFDIKRLFNSTHHCRLQNAEQSINIKLVFFLQRPFHDSRISIFFFTFQYSLFSNTIVVLFRHATNKERTGLQEKQQTF